MKKLFQWLHGKAFTSVFLHQSLILFANDLFCKAYQHSPSWDLLSELQKHEFAIRHEAEHTGLPPVFFEFVKRMMHRLVAFLELRQCSDGCIGFHYHGEKPFYNPDTEGKRLAGAFDAVLKATNRP
jgi:hypothetical protein